MSQVLFFLTFRAAEHIVLNKTARWTLKLLINLKIMVLLTRLRENLLKVLFRKKF